MNLKAIFFFVTVILFAGCEEKKEYIPTDREESLIKAYAAVLLLHEQFGPTADPDSLRLYQSRLDSSLTSHGFTREEFQREFEALINSPERFKPLLQQISTLLQSRVDRR